MFEVIGRQCAMPRRERAAVERRQLFGVELDLEPVRFGGGEYPRALVGRKADAFAEGIDRSEEHTSELQSLMRISYAVFCLKKKHNTNKTHTTLKQSKKQLSYETNN